MYKQAGEAYYLMKDYEAAAEQFEETKDLMRILECYDLCRNFDKILESLYKYKN